jgi:anti-anti-sigma factor
MPEPSYAHLTSRVENGALVLTLTDSQIRGDAIAEALRAELLDAVARSGVARVVLDMKEVEFISSVAFRPLLQLHGKVKDLNGRLIICEMSPAVAEVMRLTRMVSSRGSSHGLFEEQPDLTRALESLNTAPN